MIFVNYNKSFPDNLKIIVACVWVLFAIIYFVKNYESLNKSRLILVLIFIALSVMMSVYFLFFQYE